MQHLIVLTHVPTDSVNEGFLPAAKSLGLAVTLLTDCADAHRAHFSRSGLPAYPDEILSCDVFNPLAVIDTLTHRTALPNAIFSNSDHLQTSTSVAADYFGLPRKDWHTTYRAKNKAEMRTHLQTLGIDTLWHATVCDQTMLSALPQIPFPVVVKPREGVASLQVSLACNHAELQMQCTAVWADHPGRPLLIEEYIDGPLYTLETLGDGINLMALGSFQVRLSSPPHFIEHEAVWVPGLPQGEAARVLDIVRTFGVGFGACHTEFVMSAQGPRLIEINYRNIGDYREFLLQETLGIPLFETVLRLYLGQALPALQLNDHAAHIRYFVASEAGTVLRAPETFSERSDTVRLTYQPLRAIGDTIALSHSNKDYLGVLRGAGTDASTLAAAIDNAAQRLSWEIKV
ncbi:ATP-grasp domain-containing protein [Undibacterium griseum]|uniref:Siderophore biosynthesis protein n=1 Tax=Undibacterium griseum TaxID=2762295 RepID=A0ABR6YN46_9BURK|nr:siderophore biosynthesis protein [Undibacterium griseum]MBC3885219.1 siderophore biosynthesis protein [Undibacterium griseum]